MPTRLQLAIKLLTDLVDLERAARQAGQRQVVLRIRSAITQISNDLTPLC